MRRPTAPAFAPAHGIAANFGGMLGALLYALLGWLRVCGARRVDGLEGTMAPVLVAQASVRLELEPIVEWEWVPAPWRAGRLLPSAHARACGVALPFHFARPFVLGRGPPLGDLTSGELRTGMA
ncbi:MAG: hypothetical protein NT133_10585 [Alphaproteobacteria bacterium]|nr:hypothetical protein [Alphaproteobacteria bacterium]